MFELMHRSSKHHVSYICLVLSKQARVLGYHKPTSYMCRLCGLSGGGGYSVPRLVTAFV